MFGFFKKEKTEEQKIKEVYQTREELLDIPRAGYKDNSDYGVYKENIEREERARNLICKKFKQWDETQKSHFNLYSEDVGLTKKNLLTPFLNGIIAEMILSKDSKLTLSDKVYLFKSTFNIIQLKNEWFSHKYQNLSDLIYRMFRLAKETRANDSGLLEFFSSIENGFDIITLYVYDEYNADYWGNFHRLPDSIKYNKEFLKSSFEYTKKSPISLYSFVDILQQNSSLNFKKEDYKNIFGDDKRLYTYLYLFRATRGELKRLENNEFFEEADVDSMKELLNHPKLEVKDELRDELLGDFEAKKMHKILTHEVGHMGTEKKLRKM